MVDRDFTGLGSSFPRVFRGNLKGVGGTEERGKGQMEGNDMMCYAGNCDGLWKVCVVTFKSRNE